MLFFHFFQVNYVFLHQSYLKTPLPVKLTWYKFKKSFFISEKIKKYRKLWPETVKKKSILEMDGFGRLFTLLNPSVPTAQK